MTRLPIPGQDNGTWGEILNDFLSQAHNGDGSLKPLNQSQITNLTNDLAMRAKSSELHAVALSGSYADLNNKPTIPDSNTFIAAANLDSQTTTLINSPNSSIAGTLEAAYGRREVYLSSYGVIADATDTTIADGTVTDNTTAVRSAFNACIDGSGRVIGVVVHDVPGWVLVSAPVNMNGVSLRGLDRFHYGFFADPRVPYTTWDIGDGSHPNDLGVLYAKGKDGWFVDNVGFDAGDSYTQPLVVWGGERVEIRNCYARRVAKNGFHFMGSRNLGDVPVRYSVMRNNIVENCIWNFAIDGEAYNCKVVDNISLNALSRHVSLDPTAAPAGSGKRVNYEFEIRGNYCEGTRTAAAAWANIPPIAAITTQSHAITCTAPTDGSGSGITSLNTIRNWGSSAHTIDHDNCSGQITDNFIISDVGGIAPSAILIGGTNQPSPTEITGNITKGYLWGLQGGAGVKYVSAHNNQFYGATQPVNFNVVGYGSRQWNNIDSSAPSDEIVRTIDPGLAITPATSGGAGRAFFCRIQQSATISKIAVWVTTAGGSIDIGVYSNQGFAHSAFARTRKASSGSVALTSTGYTEIPLGTSVVVQSGDWLAVSFDNTTVMLEANMATHAVDQAFAGLAYYKVGSFPLPSGISSTGTTDRVVFKLVGVA